jgi:nicotinamide riboside kinase
LSRFLADHFQTAKLITPYEKSDLTKIAHGQSRLEDEWITDAHGVLICDTNALVVKIWSEYKYGDCDPDILRQVATRHYDLYLLTYIDVPWEDDPQREHPGEREKLWEIYRREVEQTGVPFIEIRGPRDERRARATEAINQLLAAS